MSVTDPIQALRDATRQILHEQHATMREVVHGLSPEALNWKPGPETNSIAVLLSHALDAERFCMSAAADVQVERDREAQFRVEVARADELLALVDRMEEEIDGYIARVRGEHLGAAIDRSNPERTRIQTGAWWLLHAVEHSREHIGQALLTRQLWERRAEG
jgi:uncharacterized damage-inducible protein DinB